MKKLWFSFIALIILSIIFTISAELMLRIFDKIKGVTSPYTHNLPECIAMPNGYFNFDLQPNLKVIYDWNNPRAFTINRWGFRSPDYEPIKPKGVVRIFCFGGSSTFDPYVSDEKAWSYLVGKKLSEKLGRKIESINAGRYGYTTSEIMGLFYHRVLRHQPDLIIIYSTYNDASIKVSPYYSLDDGPQYYGNPLLSFLNKHSALFAFLDFKLRYLWNIKFYTKLIPTYAYLKEEPQEHKEFVKDKDRAMSYKLELYKRNLKTIIHIAKDNNVEVLLSTQLVRKEDYKGSVCLITDGLREIAQEENVAIVDFDKLKTNDSDWNNLLATYVHFTPKGCEFVSSKLVEAILKNNLIKN